MFSKPYINKMLQATNAETLPMRLNSIRHIEPYKGSLDPQDLLDLYVGDTNYRQINKALRSPDVQTARQQVWDEAGLMKPKQGIYQGVPEEYLEKYHYGMPSGMISNSIESAKFDASDILDNPEDYNLNEVGNFFKGHPLAYTPNFNNLPIGEQAKQVVNYVLPNRETIQPSLQDRFQAQNYLNQTLASIPHVEQTLVNQPRHQLQQVIDPREELDKNTAESFDNYLNKANVTGDKTVDNDMKLALENYSTLQGQKMYGLVDNNWNHKPDAVYKFISNMRKIDAPLEIIKQPITRGLHFKDESDYNNFINQHQPGQVIEYPAFTSTTIRPNIQASFANERRGEIPVLQSFEPAPGQSQFNAYDVYNDIEGERLYPPGQRFKVINSQNSIDGGSMTLQETNELTPIEQRTSDILSRMKPRIANLA